MPEKFFKDPHDGQIVRISKCNASLCDWIIIKVIVQFLRIDWKFFLEILERLFYFLSLQIVTFIKRVMLFTHSKVFEEHIAPLVLDVGQNHEHAEYHAGDDGDHHHQAAVRHPGVVTGL